MHLIYRRLGKSPTELREKDEYMVKFARIIGELNQVQKELKEKNSALNNQKQK